MPGRNDVKRDLAMQLYLLFVPFRLYGNNFVGTFFVPRTGKEGSRFTEPGLTKVGQFLSYKHFLPLCRDDIMLILRIVPGEIVPGRNIIM